MRDILPSPKETLPKRGGMRRDGERSDAGTAELQNCDVCDELGAESNDLIDFYRFLLFFQGSNLVLPNPRITLATLESAIAENGRSGDSKFPTFVKLSDSGRFRLWLPPLDLRLRISER